MHDYSVPLQPPVPLRLSDELSKRIFFVAEEIESFTLKTGSTGVEAVQVSTSRSVDSAELTRKIGQMVASDVLPQRAIRSREIWRSPHQERTRDDVFEEMLATGSVTESGEGQFGFGEPFIGLVSYLDKTFSDIAVDRFGAELRTYPALIRTEVLSRSGYISSFPQFLLTANRLHSDADHYQDFVGEIESAASAEDSGALAEKALERHGTHAGYVLSPAVCYHVYQQYAGALISSPGKAVTAVGKCFRHESRYHRSLERLWEFTMREVVFIGTREYVAQARHDIMAAVWEVIEEMGLPGRCETASDPFFLNVQAAQKVWSQRALELKYELQLPVGGGRSVAAASFNVHGQNLGSAFDLRNPDSAAAFTGCAAFGLERIAYAFLCQFGLDPGNWPDRVRSGI
ncbi:hypothetical protein ACFS5L_38970 [Streptomyces phyllanthi]|uniref:Aminoacyl-transfer RNA synthetases class-II family profile domain-containing protein n=1 Tax=Streptomyces phyllanthi TaxID=1803180 RepID=A0A5N8VVE5_9ACTN|nr:hypothetical protein [Streptomyces phyllanthi]MPY38959.1 hypothetical protein [Streptomyces phyllanthi]